MAGYNNDSLYVPRTYEQLEQARYLAYNTFLLLSGKQEISYEQYRTSNIKIAFETATEIDLQSELVSGMLYGKITKYIQEIQALLQTEPFGCTDYGISNAFLSIDGITEVAIDQPDRPNTTMENGTYSIALDKAETVTDDVLFSTFLSNNGVGIKTIGESEVSGADRNGTQLTYAYTSFSDSTLKIKLFYKYDNNWYGNKLLADDIVERYKAHWEEVYKTGNDLKPAEFNDISYFPSLAYLDSQFSFDDGVTFEAKNKVKLSAFNERYTYVEPIEINEEDEFP